MDVRYADAFYAWDDFRTLVALVIKEQNVKSIAEIGAGANPLLKSEFVRGHGITYHLVDSSPEELHKAGDEYIIHVADMEKELIDVDQKFDLVIAQMTLEHIRYPKTFFNNIRQLLNPGGRVCLFFASVTNLPMLVNRILPDSISEKLLMIFQPFRKNEKHGKFKAFYKWCYGPTRANIRRFQAAGFDIRLYTGFFGHTYYKRLPLLHRLEKKKTAWLLKHPMPGLCTYGQVVLSVSETYLQPKDAS